MITQDLGIATAYGYAKSKGYTGTEAEFAELMASYASTAQTAIEAADRAVEANTAAQSAKTDAAASKTSAQTAAQTATTKASEASQSASTATTKASEASQSASTASAAATSAGTSAQTATAAATTATTKASEASESATTASAAKTDAEAARDAAAQSASEAAESARTLTIDATLTQSGQAADAKAVGDKIDSLNGDINELNTSAIYRTGVEWESGYIDGSTGVESDNANYSRTVDYIPTTEADYVSAGGTNFTLILFDLEDGSYIRKASKYVRAAESPWAIDKRYGYFRISGTVKIANHPENAFLIYKYTKSQGDLETFKTYFSNIYVAKLYISEGKEVNWTQTASKTTLDLSQTTGFCFENFTPTYDIPKSTILSVAQSSQYTTVDGDTISGNNFSIIYDIDTKTVSVVKSASARLAPNKRNLFSVYYASSVSGDIVDAEMRRRWENTISRIESLEGVIDSNSTLPDYWKTYMQTKIRDVQAKDMIVGNHGDMFVFCTDQHFPTNDGYSPELIRYVLNNSSVNTVIMGGDLIQGSNVSKQIGLDSLVDARNRYRLSDPKYLRGNHDSNTEISGRTPELAFSDDEVYSVLMKPVESDIVSNGQMYYFFDNQEQKIRYICLDTGHPDTHVIEDAQITWMQERIQELQTGWTVVVITHQFFDTPPTKDGNGDKIEASLDAIYDEIDATIACVIAGHSHIDAYTTSAKGYPIIVTTCDLRGGEGSGQPRTKGTITEQAFDVFHIDTTNRNIYATRIGFGSDRNFSY